MFQVEFDLKLRKGVTTGRRLPTGKFNKTILKEIIRKWLKQRLNMGNTLCLKISILNFQYSELIFYSLFSSHFFVCSVKKAKYLISQETQRWKWK